MLFLSGKFSETQQKWYISQREKYPIIHVIARLGWLVFGHEKGVTVFSDHKNIIYVLRPHWGTNKNNLSKLMTWALLLQSAHFNIRHIDGSKNVFADIITRWMKLENSDATKEINLEVNLVEGGMGVDEEDLNTSSASNDSHNDSLIL